MRINAHGVLACWLAALSFVCLMRAQTAAEAVQDFDTLVRNYNLITFGNATFTNYGDTEGGLAIGGNLTLNTSGAIATQSGKYTASSDPTLYVNGQLTLNGDTQLNSGYASTPNLSGTWTWSSSQDLLTSCSGGKLYTVNSSDSLADVDPRTNSTPSSWNWTTLKSEFVSLSTALAAATPTGSVSVVGQTLTFVSTTTEAGVVVINLDASLLCGNTYDGQTFSSIVIDIAENQTFVINVLNADGTTLFGSGVNFNYDSDYSRLLWNIVGSTSCTTTVSLGNGGQFYGSILAPLVDLSNAYNTAISGQVVANSLTYSGAELHYTDFAPSALLVPEPATYALWAVGLCGAAVWWQRRRAHLHAKR